MLIIHLVWFIYPETANVRLEDMNSLFGDATTAAPTPQTLAEAESLFSGNRSPVPSFRLGEGDSNVDPNVPDLDIDPPHVDVRDGKPIMSNSRPGSAAGESGKEGVGGWISGIVNRNGKGADGGSGSYKKVGQDDDGR